MCYINDKKIKNTNDIFEMKDDNNIKISKTYAYYEEVDIEKKNQYKFVIIGNEKCKNILIIIKLDSILLIVHI